jgi:hypothetical protein
MELNKSSVFVLPVLGKHYSFYTKALEQCYICESPQHNGCICFIFSSKPEYGLDGELEKLPGFKVTQQKEDKFIYYYSIPEEFTNDIELFKKGKYNEMSDIYKQRILSCNISPNKGNVKSTKLYQILYKSIILRKYWEDMLGHPLPEEAEVWSSPDMEKETYK